MKKNLTLWVEPLALVRVLPPSKPLTAIFSSWKTQNISWIFDFSINEALKISIPVLKFIENQFRKQTFFDDLLSSYNIIARYLQPISSSPAIEVWRKKKNYEEF